MARNAKNKRRGNRRGESALGKVGAVIVGLFVIVIIGGMFYMNLSKEKVILDSNSLCQIGKKPSDVIAILIDATESLPERAARQAVIKIENILSSAPENSLINLYAIKSGNESHIEPITHICKPQNGVNMSNLTGNKRFAKDQYEQSFSKPLKAHINNLIVARSSASSPLVESMQSAIIESFTANPNTGLDRLIIVSDMIQNTSMYSFYREKPSYKNFDEMSNRSGKGMLRLEGITVDMLVVARDFNTGNREDVVSFWSSFLQERGASSGSSMEPLL